jgi:hypothetical protein
MGWKDWPYWLKGGVLAIPIGFILFFVGILLVMVGNYLACPQAGEGVCRNDLFSVTGGFLVFMLTWSVKYISSLDVQNELQIYFYNFLKIILPIIQVFLVGIIVGWIYGKIKSRNQ